LPGFEHRDQHGQKSISDAPKCSAMSVADAAQLGIVMLAVRIAQNAATG